MRVTSIIITSRQRRIVKAWGNSSTYGTRSYRSRAFEGAALLTGFFGAEGTKSEHGWRPTPRAVNAIRMKIRTKIVGNKNEKKNVLFSTARAVTAVPFCGTNHVTIISKDRSILGSKRIWNYRESSLFGSVPVHMTDRSSNVNFSIIYLRLSSSAVELR